MVSCGGRLAIAMALANLQRSEFSADPGFLPAAVLNCGRYFLLLQEA